MIHHFPYHTCEFLDYLYVHACMHANTLPVSTSLSHSHNYLPCTNTCMKQLTTCTFMHVSSIPPPPSPSLLLTITQNQYELIGGTLPEIATVRLVWTLISWSTTSYAHSHLQPLSTSLSLTQFRGRCVSWTVSHMHEVQIYDVVIHHYNHKYSLIPILWILGLFTIPTLHYLLLPL